MTNDYDVTEMGHVQVSPDAIWEGDVRIILAVEPPTTGEYEYHWTIDGHPIRTSEQPEVTIHTAEIPGYEGKGLSVGAHTVRVQARPRLYERAEGEAVEAEESSEPMASLRRARNYLGKLTVQPRNAFSIDTSAIIRDGAVPVTLQRADVAATDDQILWEVIRSRTNAISFANYSAFIDGVLCPPGPVLQRAGGTLGDAEKQLKDFPMRLPFPFVDAYSRLKVATELFLMFQCGLAVDRRQFESIGLTTNAQTEQLLRNLRNDYLAELRNDPTCKSLPYLDLIQQKLLDFPLKSPFEVGPCYGVLRYVCDGPCLLELIWSYWHEEGMLVQTMNAISRRFQNIRGPTDLDPLAYLEIGPLLPINNILWGYVQDEQHRLSVVRRAFEYDHQYGLTLYGKAIPSDLRTADRRSKFLEAFHNLLYWTTEFYKEDDDTTVHADAFRLLQALKEMQLLLAEGMHNQFGDLPSTARMEMLMQQWLLARPEMREFLGGRIMIPYREPWMDRVDRMKNLQGWTDVNVTHFADLARFGEQLLLSIRYGNWSAVDDMASAANWARAWRVEVQGYIHAYRAVTGVDLGIELTSDQSAELRYMQPSELLRRRLAGENMPALPSSTRSSLPAGQSAPERRSLPAAPVRRPRANGQS